MTEKKIRLKLIKSMIGASQRQVKTLHALGLRKMQQEVEHVATPQILGMVSKMQRWIEVN
ncbi:MAG TPA: 50S ribosomal protein L30 [Candidatus Rifleibacterium sp.]|nr:50S ribosomal protein L30 [Candidatus Rifleibacterium sp.]HPT46863.1 50S ribosomal protein L30 [Candidatus Rifleibacterium sp.]